MMFFVRLFAQSPTVEAGIEGTIKMSPAHGGAVRVGEQSSRPLANISFVITKEGSTVAEFTTDDQGRFKVSVAPGHYTVTRKGPQKGIGHFGPFAVDVAAGQMTKVAWNCDSGMR
jgi:hypothetical protein